MITDLSYRRLIDLPADVNLETFSRAALIDEVRRVVAGPCTWTLNASDPPTLLRRKVIPIEGHGYQNSSDGAAHHYLRRSIIWVCLPG